MKAKTLAAMLLMGLMLALPVGAMMEKTGDGAITALERKESAHVYTISGALTAPSDGNPVDIASKFLTQDYERLAGRKVDVSELRILMVKESLTANHVRFYQTYAGYGVMDGQISVHIRKDGVVQMVHNELKDVDAELDKVLITKNVALQIAKIAVNAVEYLPYLPRDHARLVMLSENGGKLAWQAFVPALEPLGAWAVYVDAATGAILKAEDVASYMDVPAKVFLENPVVLSKDPNFRDGPAGMDDETFTKMLSDVVLKDVDDTLVLVGHLSGPYIFIMDKLEYCVDGVINFDYTRQDPRFEGVMCYYDVDSSQRYIQSFGFTDMFKKPISVGARGLPGVINGVCIHGGMLGLPDPFTEILLLGWHGVAVPGATGVMLGLADAGEDPCVILHEYGHAILGDAGFSSGAAEGGAVHEGFADWWAAVNTAPYSNGTWDNFIGEWFSSYVEEPKKEGEPPAIRNMDNNKTVDDMEGEVHADGEIWSGPLWELWQHMGRENASRLVLESIHFYPSTGGFVECADAILQADVNLNNGTNGYFLLKAFEKRHITDLTIPEGLKTSPPAPPVEEKQEAPPEQKKFIPGFEIAAAVALLGAVTVLKLRRRK